MPSGPGERPKRSCSARHDSDGRVSLAAVFGAEVDRRCPGVVHRSACSDPDVLQAGPACAIRAEDDLEPVLADVRLDVVRGAVVHRGDRGSRPEAVACEPSAHEDVSRDARRHGAAREVEELPSADLDVRRPLLVELAVRPAADVQASRAGSRQPCTG